MVKQILLVTMLGVALLLPPHITRTGTVEPSSEPLFLPEQSTISEKTLEVMDAPLHKALPKYEIKAAVREIPPKEEKTPPNLEIPLDDELKEFIYKKCNQDDDMYCFILAVIQAESEFVTTAVSADGHDKGLMQLRDTYYEYWMERYHVSDPLEPHDNLTVGISLLYEYLEKYEQKSLALMCYNHGETGAKRLWNEGVYSTKYTTKVLNTYEDYLTEAKE